jgi:hypothetical protein
MTDWITLIRLRLAGSVGVAAYDDKSGSVRTREHEGDAPECHD